MNNVKNKQNLSYLIYTVIETREKRKRKKTIIKDKRVKFLCNYWENKIKNQSSYKIYKINLINYNQHNNLKAKSDQTRDSKLTINLQLDLENNLLFLKKMK